MPHILTIALALAATGAGTAPAQTTPTTGALRGRAADETGAVLPGVVVTATSPALQGQQVVYTGPDGSYRIPAISPGTYRVVFELPGFTTFNREGIEIGLGFQATINATMRVATVEETITVRGASPVVDITSTKVVANFNAAQLANLPGARDFWAIVANVPSMQMSRTDVGGSRAGNQTGYAAYDTKMTQHRPMVEGMVMTEGRGGACFYYDFGSMDEVSVRTGANDASMGWPGVQTQFIAKSGGNAYHGTARSDYQCGDWQAHNIDDAQIALGVRGGEALDARDTNRMYRYWDFNVDLGGYVVKDKLWVYGSGREQDIRQFRPNFPVKPFRTHLNNLSGKATYVINRDNKAIFYTMYGRKNQPNRLNFFILPSSAAIHRSTSSTWNQLYWGSVTKGEWNSVLSDRAFFEIRGGKNGYDWPNSGHAPDEFAYMDLATNEAFGGNRNNQTDRHRAQLLTSLTYFQDGWAGTHNVKVGGELFREIRRGHNGGLTRNPRGVSTSHYFRGDMIHVLQNGTPVGVYIFETPSTSDSRLWTYSAYVSDSWAVNQHLTLNLGARYDRYRSYLPAQRHDPGRIWCYSDECLAGGKDFPARDVNTWNNVAPRVGATFDVAGDGKTVIKTNYARYWWNPAADLAADVNDNSVDWGQHWTWADLNGDGFYNPGSCGQPRYGGEDGQLVSSAGGTATTFIDPNIENTQTTELAVWVERELFPNVGLRAGYVYRQIDQLWQRFNGLRAFDDFNIPVEVQDPGPDGRPGTADDGGFVTAFNLDPAVLALGPNNTTTNIAGMPEFHTIEVSGTKRMADDWSLVTGFSYRIVRDHEDRYVGSLVRTRNGGGLENPNQCINTSGPPDCTFDFRTWTFKVNGTWNGPAGLIVSPNLRHQSGQPFGRIFRPRLNYGRERILAEPIDTNRQDHITVFDIRTEKAFMVGPHRGGRLIGFFDLYNIIHRLLWSYVFPWCPTVFM